MMLTLFTIFGLGLLLSLLFDKPKKKSTKCQECDDEYGNCWKCNRI